MRIGTFGFRNRDFGSCIYVKGDLGTVVWGWLATVASLPAFSVVRSESIGVPIICRLASGYSLQRL